MTIEVKAQNKDTKIKIVLGIVGCLTIIILAAMFQTAAILILSPVGFIYAVKQLISLRSYGVIQNEQMKQIKAETKIKEAKAALAWEKVNHQKELTDQVSITKYFQNTNVGTFVISPDTQEIKFYATKQKKGVSSGLQIPEIAKPLTPILDRLKSGVQILISGPTKSGKTTLCQHLLAWLASQGYAIIPCDIHSPGTMLGYDVVGSGRNFKAIFNALELARETMNSRYNDDKYNPNDPSVFQGVAIFIDELTTLIKEAKKLDFDLSDVLETLLTEGRKVNIMLILSIHSLDVKTLGLTAGIRENNLLIQLYGGQGQKHQCYEVPPLASIRSKKDWIEHIPAGPFSGYPDAPKVITKLPDAREVKIKNLSKQGLSPTAIASDVFDVKKPSGERIRQVKEILEARQ